MTRLYNRAFYLTFAKKHYLCNMNTEIVIRSSQPFHFQEFIDYLEIPDMILDHWFEVEKDSINWQFHREGISTTLFVLSYNLQDVYTISIDNLASYDDLKFFPYLVDSLAKYLNGSTNIDHIYQQMNEEWVENTISEEIARLKGTLTVVPRYFFAQAFNDFYYVSEDILYPFGVNLHSSTPRIYGYIQYMLRNELLPSFDDWDEIPIDNLDEEVEVDIPQHIPIGRVKSWQLDGSETYETYSQEDVDHLLELADEYDSGLQLPGVVLNDIGTIHQEGIGIPVDGEEAIYWFTEAYEAGDTLYAPTNLGDLYRKGCGKVKPNLKKAFEAYQLSTDPYAHYRIGQAYEEGWMGNPDMELAMKWYHKAAEEGHHLAIKRLG